MRIDTALLDKLLDSTGKGDTIAAQMQGLQRQGYLKLDGKALTTHLTFQGGHLKVNDLPFPPMPAAGPGPGGLGCRVHLERLVCRARPAARARRLTENFAAVP